MGSPPSKRKYERLYERQCLHCGCYLSYSIYCTRLAQICKCLCLIVVEKSMRKFGMPGKHLFDYLGQIMDIIQNEPPLAVAIRCYCCCFLCKIGVERLFAVKFRHQRNFRVSVSHPHFPSPYFQLRCFLFSHRTLSP